jgi:hypothetical protein
VTARDEDDPRLTQAMGLWAETAVPALPDDFAARVMADVVAARAVTAWADEGVPELPDDFTARVMADVAVGRAVSAWEASVPALPADFAATVAAKAAARPRLQVVEGGGAAKPATTTVEATPRSRRAWLWPVVAVAAAGLLALWTSRSPEPGGRHDVVAQRTDAEAPVLEPVLEPVLVAMAEVTRVDVVGVQSVAVMSVLGEGGGVASPVVWITDKDEDDGTRMQ